MKLHSTTTAGQLIEARRNVKYLADTLAAWQARADKWDAPRIEIVRQGLADAESTRDALSAKLTANGYSATRLAELEARADQLRDFGPATHHAVERILDDIERSVRLLDQLGTAHLDDDTAHAVKRAAATIRDAVMVDGVDALDALDRHAAAPPQSTSCADCAESLDTDCPDCGGYGIITATRTGTDGAPCPNCTTGPATW